MKRRNPQFAFVLAAALFIWGSLALAGVSWPQYTHEELNTADFVKAELQKYTTLRQAAEARLPKAQGLDRMAVKSDLQKIISILEALQYVKAHGYNPKDPEVRKFTYFQQCTPHTLPVQPRSTGAEGDKEGAEKIYELSEPGLVAPAPVATPNVDVPPELIGDGLSGVVKVKYTIDEKGMPTDLHILSGLHKDVDALVEKTILDQWQYKPATLDGKPVKVYLRTMINFDLKPKATPPPPAE